MLLTLFLNSDTHSYLSWPEIVNFLVFVIPEN